MQDAQGDDFGVHHEDLRVFFSGRKGFHIEVRPSALGIALESPLASQLKASAEIQKRVTRLLKRQTNKDGERENGGNVVTGNGTVIDLVYGTPWDGGLGPKHPYVRLSNSINHWIGASGTIDGRRRIQINPHGFQYEDQANLLRTTLSRSAVV